MYISNLTRHDGSLSSISVADPAGRSASFTVEAGEACAYASIMLATELGPFGQRLTSLIETM